MTFKLNALVFKSINVEIILILLDFGFYNNVLDNN